MVNRQRILEKKNMTWTQITRKKL